MIVITTSSSTNVNAAMLPPIADAGWNVRSWLHVLEPAAFAEIGDIVVVTEHQVEIGIVQTQGIVRILRTLGSARICQRCWRAHEETRTISGRRGPARHDLESGLVDPLIWHWIYQSDVCVGPIRRTARRVCERPVRFRPSARWPSREYRDTVGGCVGRPISRVRSRSRSIRTATSLALAAGYTGKMIRCRP